METAATVEISLTAEEIDIILRWFRTWDKRVIADEDDWLVSARLQAAQERLRQARKEGEE